MRRSALTAIVVAAFLGASAASATTIVTPGSGGWTVSIGGEWVKYGHYASSVTFHSKTTAENAGKYLNEMEAAAANDDKGAFNHAVKNLQVVEDIAKQKQDEAWKKFQPVNDEINQAVHDEVGDPPDILEYHLFDANGTHNQANSDRYNKDKDDYYARRKKAYDEKLKQRLEKDPQAKVTYDQAQRATDDVYAIINLVVDFANLDTFLRISEVVRQQKAERKQAQQPPQQPPTQPAPPPTQPKTANGGISAPDSDSGSVLRGNVLGGDVLQGIGVAAAPTAQPNRTAGDSDTTSQPATATHSGP